LQRRGGEGGAVAAPVVIEMTAYLVRRTLLLIPLFLVVSFILFLLVHLVPGDPIDNLVQPGAGPELKAQLVAKYGLDQPLVAQYLIWLRHVLAGDLGDAIVMKRPVSELILGNIPYSLSLGLSALAFSTIVGMTVGGLAASFAESRFDHGAMSFSLIGSTVPTFWLGLVLILIFAVALGWLPVSGARDWRALVLPVLTIGIAGTALIARVTRVAMVEASRKDFVLLLHAKGMSPLRIQLGHVLRHALVPVVTILGLRIGYVLGGAITVEYVFARPGLGTLLIRGLGQRDYPVVQGSLLMLAMAVMLGTLAADILHTILDPRIRDAR